MTFNPIVKQITADVRLSDEIKLGMVGVLYQKGRYTRTLSPGEELPWLERRQRDSVYIVDTGPKVLTLSYGFPDKEHDRFPLQFSIVCQVEKNNAPQVVERHLTDVDSLVGRTLEVIARPLCRKRRLHEYDQLLAEIQDGFDFALCADQGVSCTQPTVEIRRSPEFDERIEQLRAIVLAKKVSQHQKHSVQLPSKTPGIAFEAGVSITYRVARAEELPAQDLAVVEQHLWEYLEPKLRRESRNFTLDQMGEAEKAVEACLADLDVIYGLCVEQLNVALSSDPEIAVRYRTREFEAIDDATAVARKVRHAKALGDFLDVYKGMVTGGQRELLALRLANDPGNVEMIMQQLSSLESDEFRRTLDQVRTIAEAGNQLSGVVDNEVQTIFRIIVNRFFGSASGGGGNLLPSTDSYQPLALQKPKDATTSLEGDEGHGESGDAIGDEKVDVP